MNVEDSYPFQEIETSAQSFWMERGSFHAETDSKKPKFYCLAMFPYPSGTLHIGHVRNYTISDIISRYQRLQGKNVLQPIGWDAFGLPAENAAIDSNASPKEWTNKNIAQMKKQLQQLGYAYDWRRELATCNKDYYRWEQQLFTRLMKPGVKGGAYRKNTTVNWDPVDQTVLANEQVIDGRGWRSGAKVEKQERGSWFLKITDYAEELLQGLQSLKHWPAEVLRMQENWIGKSVGATISFKVCDAKGNQQPSLDVFTTRPDTIYGATFTAISPFHPFAKQAALSDSTIADFIEAAAEDNLNTEKKGIKLSHYYAIHPFTNQSIPIYIVNYVLMEYGTGAIMAVPAHDERDLEFAKIHSIPVETVIEDNTLVQSDEFNGLTSDVAKKKIITKLETLQAGKGTTTYRLRDWGVSRQRYWGCPIPAYFDKDGTYYPAEDLPVVLPDNSSKQGASSHLIHDKEFISSAPDGFTREADTFDTFFESSWYYARFASYQANSSMLDSDANYWLPVDQYVGGVEHAVLHLLYARYFHKVMRDHGMVECDEPFKKLLTQGMVVAATYRKKNSQGRFEWVDSNTITKKQLDDGSTSYVDARGDEVEMIGIQKMSKSKKNGVDPKSLIALYGADALRLYITFAAPPVQQLEWSSSGLRGCAKFCKKLFMFSLELENDIKKQGVSDIPSATLYFNQSHANACSAICKALVDYERQQYNTVVSSVMIIYNEMIVLRKNNNDFKELCAIFHACLILLAPITPHLCHHLYRRLNFGNDISHTSWLCLEDFIVPHQEIKVVIQVNGKKRGLLTVAKGMCEEDLVAAAKSDAGIAKHIHSSNPRVVFVQDILLNFVG